MVTSVVERVFVDTNVLVYLSVQRSPLHAAAVARLAELRRAQTELWISRQVLREYVAALSRPQSFSQPVAMAVLIPDLQRLLPMFRVANETASVTTRWMKLLVAYPVGGKRVHDANIVATVQAHRIRKLLTHDTTDFAPFASVITVLPLVP